MSIEELQAQQKDFEEWQTLSTGLQSALDVALKQVPSEVSRLSGLKLRSFHDSKPYLPARAGGFSVRGDKCFWLLTDGANARAEVSTMACTVTRSSAGEGYVYQFSARNEDQKFGLKVILKAPAVPMTVSHYSWVCNLWWHGPSDSHKLAATIVDALAQNKRDSEFTLKRIRAPVPLSSYGCLLALLAGAIFVIYVLWSG